MGHHTADLEWINKSYIVLIPKKIGTFDPDHLRPISPQNYPVKLYSKCLTNCVQPIIPDLVHADQSGFIKGRNIAENFILAADIVQAYHKRKCSAIVLKLDFKKAFNSIAWDSL